MNSDVFLTVGVDSKSPYYNDQTTNEARVYEAFKINLEIFKFHIVTS